MHGWIALDKLKMYKLLINQQRKLNKQADFNLYIRLDKNLTKILLRINNNNNKINNIKEEVYNKLHNPSNKVNIKIAPKYNN